MIITGDEIRNRHLFNPFHDRTVAFGMTYGRSYAGYDVRVEFDQAGEQQELILPPQGFALVSSIEYLRNHYDLLGSIRDKSSWARRGLSVFNTVIEPGWEGYITIELVNHSDKEIMLERDMPIAQVVFEQLTHVVDGYDGKYQYARRGPQEAIIDAV